MFKRYLMVLTMLLALPSFANAWYVNAKAGTVGGAVSPAGTLAYTNGQASGEYTVTPAAGYSVQKVTLDGVGVTLTNNKLTVPYVSTKSWRYVVAYFQGATYSINRTITGNGVVREDTNESLTGIPAGANRQVLVAPAAGYTASVTAAGATSISAPDQNGAIVVVFNNITANQDLAVTFTLTPVRTANAGQDVTAGLTAATATTLFGAATSNQGAITYAWSGDGLTFGTPAAATTTVYAAVPGTYTATLTATSGGVDVTDTAVVTVRNTQNDACVSCHSLNTPTVVAEAGSKTCVTCHTDNAHANWDTKSEPVDYQYGMHAAASGHATGTCQRCHTSDGAINGAATGWTGGYAEVLSVNTYAPVTALSGITCAGCHTHSADGNSILRPIKTRDAAKNLVTWDPNGNLVVDQYDECTQCHTMTNNAGDVVGNYHNGSSKSVERTITDSHYDNPATAVTATAGGKIEGYVIRKNGSTPCADCHNLHKADTTIQKEWAESGHGGKILLAKEATACTDAVAWYNGSFKPAGNPDATDCAATVTIQVPPATSAKAKSILEHYQSSAEGFAAYTDKGADDALAPAWTHYNWDQVTGTGNRASCEKCHTATGAANYMSNPAGYNAANNNYSHLAGWTAATGSAQNELLYCWGCHSNSQTGELRQPGAITTDYNFNGVKAVMPNVDASNTCLVCHSGRESGESLNAITDFANAGFKNSHYMAAGGLMYAKAGFTAFTSATAAFGTSTYGASLTATADGGALGSTHRKLGTPAMATDSHPGGRTMIAGGPCVTCHYAGGEHGLEIGATAFTQVCVNCHTAEGTTTLTTANFKELFIEEQAVPFQDALALAKQILLQKYKILYDKTANPYFFEIDANGNKALDVNGKGIPVTNWSTRDGQAVDGKKLMGASFNLNILARDPAAYVHARTYTRRLIYDSIDFLDDGTINMSTVATAVASDPVKYVVGPGPKDAATTAGVLYLKAAPYGSSSWSTVERP